MILSNDSLVTFHYRSYGTFFLHKNRLHNIYRGFTHYKYYRAIKENFRYSPFVIGLKFSFLLSIFLVKINFDLDEGFGFT